MPEKFVQPWNTTLLGKEGNDTDQGVGKTDLVTVSSRNILLLCKQVYLEGRSVPIMQNKWFKHFVIEEGRSRDTTPYFFLQIVKKY